MSSSLDKSRKLYNEARKRNLRYCSTPIADKISIPSIVSISSIGSNSSSGSEQQRGKVQKETKKTKKTQEKKKKNAGKGIKKGSARKDSDTDWETKSEESVCGDENSRRDSVGGVPSSLDNFLFEELPSPQRVRDAGHFKRVEAIDSPPFRLRHRRTLSPQNDDYKEKDVPLLRENMPFINLMDSDDEDEDEPLCLTKENVKKSYTGPGKKKRDPMKPDSRYKKWLIDLKVPTASSNLLWDEFMKKIHAGKEGSQVPLYKSSSEESLSVAHLCNVYNKLYNTENKDAVTKRAELPIAKKIRKSRAVSPKSTPYTVIHGRWDKSAKKFIHETRVHLLSDSERKELYRTRGTTFDKFPWEQKADKEKRRIPQEESTSSTKKYRTNEKKVMENPREDVYSFVDESSEIFEREKLKPRLRKRRVREILSPAPESVRIPSKNVFDREKEKVKEASTTALQLNAKRKSMFSSEISSDECETQNDTRESITSRVKRRNENDTKPIQSRTKRQRIDSKKPKIRSIEVLTPNQCKEFKRKLASIRRVNM